MGYFNISGWEIRYFLKESPVRLEGGNRNYKVRIFNGAANDLAAFATFYHGCQETTAKACKSTGF